VQSATASFTPFGFDAAAITTIGLTGHAPPREWGFGRQVRLHFDHPYAAIALSGSANDFRRSRAGHSDNYCLPLFSAWVDAPEDPPSPM